MKIEFDPEKSAVNRAKRGFGFELAARFDLATAILREDMRRDYGEQRWQALGLIDGRLYAMTFTVRGDALRVISLRKANRREQRIHDPETSV